MWPNRTERIRNASTSKIIKISNNIWIGVLSIFSGYHTKQAMSTIWKEQRKGKPWVDRFRLHRRSGTWHSAQLLLMARLNPFLCAIWLGQILCWIMFTTHQEVSRNPLTTTMFGCQTNFKSGIRINSEEKGNNPVLWVESSWWYCGMTASTTSGCLRNNSDAASTWRLKPRSKLFAFCCKPTCQEYLR